MSPEAFIELLATVSEWAEEQWGINAESLVEILLDYHAGKSEVSDWVESEVIPYLRSQ